MKSGLWKNILATGIAAVALSSCDYGDTNINPANPEAVGMSGILPAGQAHAAWVVGGDYTRYSGILTQQFQGINAQQADNTNYLIREGDVNGLWQITYAGALNTCNKLRKQAVERNAPHYQGVANVMIAATASVVTDAFGDIPLTDALQGDQGNLTPTYDTQESLYTRILPDTLDAAIAQLSQQTSVGGSPGSTDDLIYGGDREKWIKAAYSIKARLALQQVKRNPTGYQEALDAITRGISSNDDDFELRFGSTPSEVGPQYQFTQSRSGNLKIAPYFVAAMVDSDVRKDFFVNPKDGEYNHDANFVFAGYYTSRPSPVVFMSYVELKFIEAEAQLMGNSNPTAAKAALDEAVQASFIKITGAPPTQAYLTKVDDAWNNATDNAGRLKALIDEKYIACYSQGVISWNDYRRTGYPEITPNPGGDNSFNPPQIIGEDTLAVVPRRLPYPEEERFQNSENIPIKSPNLQQRFWWDQEPMAANQ